MAFAQPCIYSYLRRPDIINSVIEALGIAKFGLKTSVYALLMARSPLEGQHYRHLLSKTATYALVGRASKEPHSRRTNLETTTRSPSNSQSSSLNGSLSSQLSQVRPNVAGDLDLIRPHGAVTPSTSLSNESSQEGIDRPCLVEPDVLPMDKDKTIDGPDTGGALNKDHTSAPKRMVNGEIKTSGSSLPTSPVESSQYGHSRNSSRTSRGSQIGEVGHLSR